MKVENLNNCPFCGSEAELVRMGFGLDEKGNYQKRWMVQCTGCGVTKSNIKSEDYTDLIERGADGEVKIIHDGLKTIVNDWNCRANGTPVKVGDAVYAVYLKPADENMYFEELKVLEVSNKRFWAKDGTEFGINDIGRSVFLTPEKARERVKELKKKLKISD